MGPLLLGIDVGTSAAKGVLVDLSGDERYWADAPYRHAAPGPDRAEQDPEDWWQAVVSVIRALIQQAPDAPRRVAGIGVSGQGVAAVLLDRKGLPVRPAILWLDSRSVAEAQEIDRKAPWIASRSGKRPAPYNVEPKLLWVMRHEPHLWERAWKVMTTTGYVTYRLTGRPVMNHSDAGILLGYDLFHRGWSDEILEALGLPTSLYCDLAESDETVGGLSPQAALATGLPEGLPVVAGGEDTSSAGLAIGAARAGDAFLSLGTASTLYVVTESTVVDPRLLTFPHVVAGTTLIGGSMAAGGGAMRWIAEATLGEADSLADGGSSGASDDQKARLARLTAEASRAPCGAGGVVFLPYLAGELQPINDGAARGAFVGLGYRTGRGELVRAVMEGVAFAIRHNLSVIEEAAGPVRAVSAVGGPTQNELWCQIIADVTGKAVTVAAEESGAPLGDAALAGLGAGLLDSPEDLFRRHVRIERRHRPDRDARPTYDRLFEAYTSLYPRLRDLFPRLCGA